ETEGRGQGRILKAIERGRYIQRRGAEIAKGQVVLDIGQIIGPAQMAAAATVGAGMVEVFARPRVAVMSTGDELVQIGETPGPAQIRNSNNIMLLGLLKQWGCEVTDLGI